MMFALPLLDQFVLAQSLPDEAIYEVAWSPDGTHIAMGKQNGIVEIIDAATQEAINSFSGTELGPLATLAWDPSGNLLATGSDEHFSRIWDAQTGELLGQTLVEHVSGIQQVVWSPNGSRIVSVVYNGSANAIQVSDSTTGEGLLQIESGAVYAVDWSPDGTRIAIGTSAVVGLIDASTGSVQAYLEGDAGEIQAVVWSPDGTRIASADIWGDVQVWDPVAQTQLLSLSGHNDRVGSLSWHPSGTMFASASDDGTVRLWDANTGSELQVIETGERTLSVSWSPDGTQIAYGGVSGNLQVVPAPSAPPTCNLAFTITDDDTAALISAITTANGTSEPDTICLANNGNDG
jgi:WD40 repeat protein